MSARPESDGYAVQSEPAERATVAQAAAGPIGYQVGDAGLVTLSVENGQLEVVSVEPGAGWTVEEIEEEDGEIEVEFSGPAGEMEFAAALQNGEIVTYVESENESYGSEASECEGEDEHEADEDEDDEHEEDDD